MRTDESLAPKQSPLVMDRAFDEVEDRKLDPRIKNVWRINDLVWILVCAIACIIPICLLGAFDEEADWADLVLVIEIVVAAVLLMLFLFVIPPIRYARWRYRVSADYLEIKRGIIWRKHFVIPFIRVQNTDTQQGPILRIFGLASVSVATAAGEHEIPGLRFSEAQILRDKAAELARLAREDV